ncbi:MAG TPA: alpha-hydroxy acid oxidase [Ktedonobacterales bacterium]|nr:alpha-hydroxy acid oxidase [Ktedonobacterales bacterium]
MEPTQPTTPEDLIAPVEPVGPINVMDYEALGRAQMELPLWDYYAGGSDDEVTLHANREAFRRLWLRPRTLVNVKTCDLHTTALGTPLSMPIIAAPTALHGLARPEGECATAAGVGAEGTLMVVSSSASRRIEDIAEAATGPLWYQLYIQTLSEAERRVRRAEAAGYRAVVLTADLPRLGNRERDLRNRLGFNNITSIRMQSAEEGDPDKNAYMGDTLTWETIDWLRGITSLPILVKGVLTAEDAELAIERGVAGIIVSNHGGRQLDGAIPSMEALPEVIAAVNGRAEVYVDGGVRRGTDVLKALALGAQAVLVGRPILWGLAANGADGVSHVLRMLHTELDRAMALSGRPTIADIDASLVRRAPTPGPSPAGGRGEV